MIGAVTTGALATRRTSAARRRGLAGLFLTLYLSCSGLAVAGPFAAPGDLSLRHDIQLLADAGLLSIPVTTWPLSWGDIATGLEGVIAPEGQAPELESALRRLRERLAEETEYGVLKGQLRLAGDFNPRRIRSFESSPREEGEAGAALEWTGLRFAVRLEASAAANPSDGRRARLDGSYAGVVLGNWMVTAGLQEQWWGPGLQGSLIVSSNARPVPAVALRRKLSLRFKSRWLSWIGPWTASFFAAQLESQRAVPDANLLGARVAFRPHRSLEIGLSRTAQWCGDGRPCGLDSFWNMLIGNDNSGEADNLAREDEPGNQLGGIDLRYSTRLLRQPLAVYGQFIGEDEAGGLPSRYLGQLGIETWGAWGSEGASYRLNLEFADTACDFPGSDRGFNCAYNNSLYPTGYRYRGRSLGHAMDNDGRMLALSGLFMTAGGRSWQLSLRLADLNRGGDPDPANTVAAVPTRYWDIELRHSLRLAYGVIEAGAGVESFEIEPSGRRENHERLFVQWRSR